MMLTREQIIQCVANKLNLQERLRGEAFPDRPVRELLYIEEMTKQNMRASVMSSAMSMGSVA